MTLTQLEYVVAIANNNSFGLAAEKCFVTQPTLSMQVQKLEDELGLRLFDRSYKPIVPTEAGKVIIEQARQVLAASKKVKEIANDVQEKIEGTLSIGIIPTLAPYLLPLFLVEFLKKYPQLQISLAEYTTAQIIQKLKEGTLDTGILATPLNENQITEQPLFYEAFVVYLHSTHTLNRHTTLEETMLYKKNIWVLEEGHCLRSQISHICQQSFRAVSNLSYETGSLETLKKIVGLAGGLTILPELAIQNFSNRELDKVRYFRSPEPVREISIVTHKNVAKEKTIERLAETIKKAVPKRMSLKENKKIMPL